MKLVLSNVAAYGAMEWWHRISGRIGSFLYVTGLVSSGGMASYTDGLGVHRWERWVDLNFHPRPYVLWRLRKYWFHYPRYGHGYYEVFGLCGKCAPWPCCGAFDEDHWADCEEVSDA